MQSNPPSDQLVPQVQSTGDTKCVADEESIIAPTNEEIEAAMEYNISHTPQQRRVTTRAHRF